MIKQKRSSETQANESAPAKRIKKETAIGNTKTKPKDNEGKTPGLKTNKTATQSASPNTFSSPQEKPNWTNFKKERKELKVKRKQSKGFFDVVIEAKSIAEKLRQKHFKTDTVERNELVLQLHNLLHGKELYAKLVLTHDMARVVQYLLKFGSENIRNNIAKEIIPVSAEMLMSKYGRYCFKNMLKYGNSEVRSLALRKLYGNAVKLCTHAVSASVFEYAYSTWASQQQKLHFIQEFFGDMYKESKDDGVKHLRDVYKDVESLKSAALTATKINLSRVLNKGLFDSGLVQSVLYQYMSECTPNDKMELIIQLAQNAVILSNSRDGARVVMQCIWHSSNKEKKAIVKAVKENLLDMSKHEFAHSTILTLLDSVDDTVLLNKSLVSQLVTQATDLVTNEWGRKVLLWLVAPGDTVHFHPTFLKELHIGRESSTCRKDLNTRREEILSYCSVDLLKYITTDAPFWLSTASIGLVTLAIIKSGRNVDDSLQSITHVISNPEWRIKEKEKDVLGIEHPGLHMVLKKLAQHDKILTEPRFGKVLVSNTNDKMIKVWLALNRGCFLLVAVYENANEDVQQELKEKLIAHKKLLKKQNSAGAKILLEKLM